MSRIKQKVDVMYSVRITQDTEDLIVKLAALEGRTKTNVIRHYLELGLKVAGKVDTHLVGGNSTIFLPEHYPELEAGLRSAGGIPA